MTLIQLKRGTAASWTAANPILSQGEMGYEIDTKRIKVGDGINPWSTLNYSYFGVGSFVQTIGDGSSTSITITHNLNTRNVVVSVKDTSTYTEVLCDVTASTVNTVTLGFATAPTTNQYIATIIADGVPTVSVNSSPYPDNNFSIKNAADPTKLLNFSLSGISTGTTRTLTVPDTNLTLVGTDAAQTLTNKDLSSATNTLPASLVTLTGTQNLSNKTLTSPTLTTPVLGTPSSGNVSACVGQVADASVVAFGASTTRATGTGDFPFGIKLQRNITFSSVTFRCATADASGNLVVELRKNGSTVSGTSTTIAAASQVAGGTSTGTWSFAAGDVLTVVITAIGTTPGKGLCADIRGLTA